MRISLLNDCFEQSIVSAMHDDQASHPRIYIDRICHSQFKVVHQWEFIGGKSVYNVNLSPHFN
jgi:hypothetical protein